MTGEGDTFEEKQLEDRVRAWAESTPVEMAHFPPPSALWLRARWDRRASRARRLARMQAAILAVAVLAASAILGLILPSRIARLYDAYTALAIDGLSAEMVAAPVAVGIVAAAFLVLLLRQERAFN